MPNALNKNPRHRRGEKVSTEVIDKDTFQILRVLKEVAKQLTPNMAVKIRLMDTKEYIRQNKDV